MDDCISRKAASRQYCHESGGCKPEECPMIYQWDGAEDCSYVRFLKELPSIEQTTRKMHFVDQQDAMDAISIYGYNIKHLEAIAKILWKEGLSPERVLEALTDIDRIIEIVRDEFEEELKKSLNNESFN